MTKAKAKKAPDQVEVVIGPGTDGSGDDTGTSIMVGYDLPPVKFDLTKRGMAALKKACAAFTKVPENTAEYKELATQIAEVRSTRTAIEARRQELNRPVLDWQASLNARAKELTAELQELEQPLIDLKKAADDEKQRQKEEKAKAERERMAQLQRKLDNIRSYAVRSVGADTEAIQAEIEALTSLEITADEYHELATMAEMARQETLQKLRAAHASRQAQDEADRQRQLELVEIEKQKEAQAKKDAEQAEQQRKLDEQQARIDEAQRKLDEQAARAAQEAADKAAAEAEAKAQAEAQAKAEAEEKALKERLQKEADEQRKQTKAWQKKMATDHPKLAAYLEALDGVERPALATQDAARVVADVGVAISEAFLQCDGLRICCEISPEEFEKATVKTK